MLLVDCTHILQAYLDVYMIFQVPVKQVWKIMGTSHESAIAW